MKAIFPSAGIEVSARLSATVLRLSLTEVAVTPSVPGGTVVGAVYVAVVLVTLLKVPQADAPPLHPVMLHVTPLLVGSFATVAAKSWLPLVRRLAVDGTTATEIAGPPPPGAVESEPQAASRQRLAPMNDRPGIHSVLMDPVAATRAGRRSPGC